MNVGLAGGLSFSFVLSWFYCVWAWLCFLVFEGFSMFHVKHDVFTTTHLFHVKRCFCFTTSQGCQCVSRETHGGVVKLLVMVFENCFSCRCRGGGVSRETLFFESYSAAGKCGSASQGINMHDYFLGVKKSKTDDVFFLIFRLLS